MNEPVNTRPFLPGSFPAQGLRGTMPAAPARKPGGIAASGTFSEVLNQKLLRFSQHAETRLEQRGIKLKPEQLDRIRQAVDKAEAKGAKDSLVMMGNMALIVDVRNKTVVTALDGSAMSDHVFTNIDSAVIVPQP